MCEVLAYRRIGDYHSLTFVAPDMAERAGPGQFVSVLAGDGTLLRRPFSIYAVSRHGPWAGTIEIVFDIVGPGTAWLAERVKHDVVDLVGPLGRGFPMPQQNVSCLLVGGGYGAAALLFLAHQLQQQQGLRVDLLTGAATQSRLFNAIEAKRLSASAAFTTEDGSFGVQGRVTDLLPDVIHSSGAGVIYACGPMPMLAAVAGIAREHRVPCQVAVEESMACGVGVCMTCVVPYRRKDGIRNLRACVEGPVFDAKRIQWADVRTDRMRGEELTL